MSMAALIRRHIRDLPDLQLFASKHLLQYATRAVVDSVLFHMVNDEEIIRLARGVFVKPHPEVSNITLRQIAEFKASVFDRWLITDAADVARQLELPVGGNANTFAINGHTSRFTVFSHFNVVLTLRGVCQRKIQESPIGPAMRALWHMGREKCTERNIEIATADFDRQNRQEMRTLAPRWMPGWLHDIIFKRRHKQKARPPQVKEDSCQYWPNQVRSRLPDSARSFVRSVVIVSLVR